MGGSSILYDPPPVVTLVSFGLLLLTVFAARSSSAAAASEEEFELTFGWRASLRDLLSLFGSDNSAALHSLKRIMNCTMSSSF